MFRNKINHYISFVFFIVIARAKKVSIPTIPESWRRIINNWLIRRINFYRLLWDLL